MGVILDEGFDFIVTVKVERVASEVDVVSLVHVVLEGLYNQTHFDASVGSEDISGVDSVDFEVPLVDDDYVSLKVGDLDAGVLGFKLINGLFSEVARHVEETISDQEVREGLLDVALDLFARLFVCELLGDLSSVLDYVGKQLFKGGLLGCGFWHFLQILFTAF